MPILDDIMDHAVLGREFRRGERRIVTRQIEKRFGAVPAWVTEQLERMKPAEIEEAGIRLMDASSLDAVFPR